MSAGDVTNPKRVRMQANERLDTVDVDGFSIGAREHLDAYARAVEAAPRNAGGSAPTGFIFQGFGLTLNPTGPSDGRVRVQSAVGVAFDADGRMLIKESGVTVDLNLSTGNTQIYAYYLESDSDTAVRRRISVSSPYTESGASIPTKSKSNVGFYLRAGDQTSIVASDVVNGATMALCFLGVAVNTAGAVTMIGYNATTAPNGSFATNRLTTVATPTTLPSASTNNGSVATMHGLVNAALFALGQSVWKGSKNFTPSAANNFGAYAPPTVGIDALFDSQAETTLTPITRWRDFQQNTRYLVDGMGYPGGEISVLDENWFTFPTTIMVDPTIGFATAGSPTISTGGVNLPASAAAWLTQLDRASVPVGPTSTFTGGAIITSIIVHYSSTNAANTLTAALSGTSLTTSTITPHLSRTVTTPVTTHSTFDIMVTPNVGQGPYQALNTERLQVQLSCSIAGGSITVQTIQVVYWVPPLGWAQFVTTLANGTGLADQVNFSDPVSTLTQRNAQLVTRSLGASGNSALIAALEAYGDNDLAHSMEFIVRTGTVTDANNTMQVVLGCAGLFNAGPRWDVFRGAGGANWFLRIDPGSLTATSVDSGVAFANNTTYRIKLQFQGANRNTSGFARARLWINGTLVATATLSGAITVGAVGPNFSVSAGTTASGPYDIRIGRVHRAWNLVPSGDNV